MAGRKKIIIAGAGFGGVRAALSLSRYKELDIQLINDGPYHLFHADLYKVATAALPNETKLEFKNLAGSVNIPLQQIFKSSDVELLIDRITEVDLPNQKVKTINKDLDYDFLVLSLGSLTNYYDVQGAKDFSHPLKTVEDALNLRNDIEELVTHSKNPVEITIAGGGFTGVELAGELPQFLKSLPKSGKEAINITIIEGSPNILSGMPIWAQKKAAQRLKNLRVQILTDKLIEKVEDHNIVFQDGSSRQFDYLVWTTGVKGENLEGRIKGVELNKKGQISVKQDLSLEKFPNVFVIGDLAECMDLKRGCPISSTAWAAISQGDLAAKNINYKINNLSTKYYIATNPVFIVPVGERYALSNNQGLKISGFLGWILKRLTSLRYFISILPLPNAVSLWWKGVRIYE